MAQVYSLPSVYLGASKEGRNAWEYVYERYGANEERFPSLNLFLRHCVEYALKHDRSLKKAA
jgi:hypothetical protein